MSDERARLFVALELPDVARTAVHQWRSEHLGGVAGLRLVGAESLHLTLCFLGSQPVECLSAIADACRTGLGGRSRLALALGEPMWLPAPRRPHVVAVGLEDVGGGLGPLQAGLTGALVKGGWYAPESRPFRPHVTVARVGRGARVRGLELPAPIPLQFVGSVVVLMRSWLGGGRGARYESVAGIDLG